MYPRPKSKLESLPLERLLFPPKCQLRSGLPAPEEIDEDVRAACCRRTDGGLLVTVADPKVARAMAEALADGAEFDPLEVVREPGKARRAEPLLIVFGGFTRGAAYSLFGRVHSVPCNVYEGTFADATFYALAENHKNVQTRGTGSARRAVETLLDSAALMERVRTAAKREGGLHKAIAAACCVGKSTVDDVLRSRGLGVDGSKLVTRKPTAPTFSPNSELLRSGRTQAPVTTSPPHEQESGHLAGGTCGGPIEPAPQPVTPVTAAPASEPAPTKGVAPEPLYTVPADFGRGHLPPALSGSQPETVPDSAPVHTPDIVTDGITADLKPAARFDAVRVVADQVLRDLRSAAEGIAKLVAGPTGPLLQKLTVAGVPLFVRRRVRQHTQNGTTERTEWGSAAVASALAAVKRTRFKATCAACRGEGCAGCRGFGFVPEDDSLIRADDQLAFDFPDPWSEGGSL